MLSTRTLDRLTAVSVFLNSGPGLRGGQPAEETFTTGTQLPALVPALQDGTARLRVAAAALARGRDLRERLTALWARAAEDEAAALEAVNALLAEVGPLRLVEVDDAAGFAPAKEPADAVERLAALAALALAEAAVEGELSRLRVCAGEDCENTLVDASRNRSKRFCDEANCANRTHVRSYRARQAEADVAASAAVDVPAEVDGTAPGASAVDEARSTDAPGEGKKAKGKKKDKKAKKAAKKSAKGKKGKKADRDA